MSYLVLARKYRPNTFADITGQEVVTATLRGAIDEGRVGHAYLLCGPRGTGKTTTARIFAKCLNCERGPTTEPCGVCERCLAADAQADVDIVEIDAASNTGIDHVRDLRDQVAYRPLRARFKIYIVDEVHMLSKQAFNAFLKTLEEPPPHVKFLFATTDPEKLPETVTSRCQVLRLSPLSEKIIAARLEHVFEAEKIRAEPGVSQELARRARGGMRDALSAADQLLSLVGAEPTLADVARLSAEGGTLALERLLDELEARDKPGVLAALPHVEGGEGELVAALLDHVRATLVAAVLGASTPQLQAEPDLRVKLRARGERVGVERLEIWLAELLAARERIRVLPAHGRAALELTLLELCRPESSATLFELVARLEALEARALGARHAELRAEPRTELRAQPRTEPRAASPVEPRTTAARETRAAEAPSPGAAAAPIPSAAGAPMSSAAAASAASTAVPPRAPAAIAAQPVRESVPHSARESVPPPAPARVAGVADIWTRTLDALAADARSLSDVLRARAKLSELANGRARIALTGVRENERALLEDARNKLKLEAAFARVAGEPVRVDIDGLPVARGQSFERVAQRDAFTGRVAELFEGRIEDEG